MKNFRATLLIFVLVVSPIFTKLANSQNIVGEIDSLRSPFRFQTVMPQTGSLQNPPLSFFNQSLHNMDNDYDVIFNEVNIDSLSLYVQQLSGEIPFWNGSRNDTIRTRFSESDGIIKAQQYLQRKLESFGYETELQEFILEKNFGDIGFAPEDPLVGWFCLEDKIYHTRDGGDNWAIQHTFETDRGIRDLEVVNQRLVFAVGYNGLMLTTNDGGKNWIAPPSLTHHHLYGVTFADTLHGWVCGNYGNIFHTNDGGSTWEAQNLPTLLGIYSIHFVDTRHGWAVGPKGLGLFTADGGENWQLRDLQTSETLLKVYFSNQQNGFILGTNGLLLCTNNFGASWEEKPLDTQKILWDIDFWDHRLGSLVGDQGTIYLTEDSGMNWRALNNTPRHNYYHTNFSTDSIIWVSGRGIFMRTNDFGNNWQLHSMDYVDIYLNNIIVTKPGKVFPDTTVILCAHYDALSEAQYRKFLAPGADDNASGTAAVLEAARILFPYDFKYTIKFILFSAEEQGLVGSRVYAAAAAARGENIAAVINLDMLGWDSNNDGVFQIHARNVNRSQQLGEFIHDLALQYPLSLEPDFLPFTGTNRSDHASFWEWNYSAVLLIEDMNDFNPNYHSIYDRFMHFNIPYYHDMSRLAIISLAKLALINDEDTLVYSDDRTVVKNFELYPPYPNPFNNTTQISFYLPRPEKVNISVFNLNGQLVKELADRNFYDGQHAINWNGQNFASGVYMIFIKAGENIAVKKCLLLK